MRWLTDQNQRVKVSFLAAVLAASSGSVLATDLNIADGTVSDKTYTDIVQIFGNKTEGSLTLSNVSVSTDETSILVAAQSGSSFTINGASQITSAFSNTSIKGSYDITRYLEHVNAALVLTPNDVVELSFLYTGVHDEYGISHVGGMKFEVLF